MKKDNKIGKKRLFIGMISFIIIFFMNGCTSKTYTQQKTTASESTKEIVDSTEKETSISYKDWPIEKNIVDGTDNLYRIDLDTFKEKQSWIVALIPYGNCFLILESSDEEQSCLYMVNPLTQELIATTQLPEGIYNSEDIYVNEQNQIEISNSMKSSIYFFDEELEEIGNIRIEAEFINGMVLSEDHSFIYYLDGEDGCIYQYETKSKHTTRIFTDTKFIEENYGVVEDLVDGDSCLVYSYYDTKEEKGYTVIRDIATGKIRYKSEAEMTNIKESGSEYVLNYNEDGLSEILYGKKEEDYPKILSFSDYKEYGQANISFENKIVISEKVVDDARDIYVNVLETEGKKDISFLEENNVSCLTLNMYDLETGLRPYTMDFYYVYGKDSYFSDALSVYLEDTDCVIIYLNCDSPQWLVWDLTKESSLSKDGENYLYAWQDPENPDRETLSSLRKRAKEIGENHGVEIHLGADVSSCPRDIYDYKISYNTIRIEKMLNLLEKALAKYPQGMLAQLDDEYGSILQIYLAGGIVALDDSGLETAIGVQNTIENQTFLVVDINSFGDLENTIYHEIFHAIENHLFYTQTSGFDNVVWDRLNPEGFEYDYDYIVNEDNCNYEYIVGDTEHDIYFVDTYAKSFPNEDRARIMEYAMLNKTDIRRHNIDGKGIQKKLMYICELLRESFDTNGWPEKTVWENALQDTE